MNTFNIIQHAMKSGATGTHGGGMTPCVPEGQAMALPQPRIEGGVSIRTAIESDFEFIDHLQKMHSHMVGWAPKKQLETNIRNGEMLIAEDESKRSVGYCLAKDHYMKRDDVGIIYQLNVLPIRQKSLIGATLIKEVFNRAAYGCRLFCCWCAQDIQANYFWESIGFIPLAFRTGSRSKQRVHIFWQRRIREGDTVTPYWFPSKTENGAVREDRLVIPIPPGTHWLDAKPVVLPNQGTGNGELAMGELPKQLPGGALVKARPEQSQEAKKSKAQVAESARSKSKVLGGIPAGKATIISRGGVKYIDRADAPPEVVADAPAAKPKRPRNSKPRMKNDPEMVKKARELRDRYLEQVNVDPAAMLPPGAFGKYEVSRMLPDAGMHDASASMKIEKISNNRLLDAA